MSDSIKQGTAYLTVATFLSMIFGYGFNVIVARTLGIHDYGLIGILISMLLISSIYSSTGISITITRYISNMNAQDKDIRDIIKKGIINTSIIGLLMALIVYLLGDIFLIGILGQNLWLYFTFMIVTFLTGYVGLSRGILQGQLRLKFLSLSIASENFFKLVFTVFFLFILKSGVNGVGTAIVLTIIGVISIGIILSPKEKISNFKSEITYWEIFKSINILAISNVLGIMILNSGPIIVKFVADAEGYELAGIFTAALTLTTLPVGVMNSFFMSLFPYLNRAYYSKDNKKLSEYIKNSTIIILVFSILSVSFLSLSGPFLIKIIYGKEFEVSHTFFFILSLTSTFYMMSFLFFQLLIITERYKQIIASRSLALVFLILFISSFYGLEPLFKVGTGLLIASATSMVLMYIFIRKILNIKWRG